MNKSIFCLKALFQRRGLLVFAAAILLNGCSHNTAYIKSGIPTEALPEPASDSVAHRLVFVGDAGQPFENPDLSVLASVSKRAAEIADRTTIVFLGDNIYPHGLPPEDAPNRAAMEAKLLPQIEAARESGARGIFIPGNHDWNTSRPGGLAAVKRQQEFVEARLGNDAFFPQNGCPGPVTVDFATFRLLIIDSEWWLHKHEKSIASCFAGDSPQDSEAAKQRFIEALIAQIKSAGDRQVVVAAHHPIATYGPHGGFFDWKDHLFPLTIVADWLWVPMPLVGSLYPLMRWHIIKSNQDLAGSANKELVAQLKDAISQAARPVIFASGHDHALQVLRGKGKLGYVLVSGAGAEEKTTKVGHGEDTYFAHVMPGFMELDVLKNGRLYLRVIEQKKDGSGFKTAFSHWLFQ